MDEGKIAESVVAKLLPDYGATEALIALIRPHIQAVKQLFDDKDTKGLRYYSYHKEGKLGDLNGVERSPESEAVLDINFVVSFEYKNGKGWSDVGYEPKKRTIFLNYDMNMPVSVLTVYIDDTGLFVRDIERFDVSIRHEVTHAVRDSQTHHLEQFIDRAQKDEKLVREYAEHGH